MAADPFAPQQPAGDLASLKAKLAKRKDEPGYADNAAAIEARIAELEQQSNDDSGNPEGLPVPVEQDG